MGFVSRLAKLPLLLAALPGIIQAQRKLDEVLARRHLIVGTGSTKAPWHFKSDTDELQGSIKSTPSIGARRLPGPASSPT